MWNHLKIRAVTAWRHAMLSRRAGRYGPAALWTVSRVGCVIGVALIVSPTATAQEPPDYKPPLASTALLAKVDFKKAKPVNAEYHRQFTACDGALPNGEGKDTFRGIVLRLPNKPENKQYYLCSRDPSNVRALLKLADGAIYWDSKMALDVDGSWAAWNGLPGATDLKQTAYKWPGSPNSAAQSAQIDPDQIPYIVMPTSGIKALSKEKAKTLGQEFAATTGLQLGDMGVVIYGNQWTPVLIGDGGPFMRLGEGSSRVFEALKQSRCKQWSSDGLRCVGPGGVYPYKNFGISRDVLFIVYPNSRAKDLTPANATARLCTFAKTKLGLTGGSTCP